MTASPRQRLSKCKNLIAPYFMKDLKHDCLMSFISRLHNIATNNHLRIWSDWRSRNSYFVSNSHFLFHSIYIFTLCALNLYLWIYLCVSSLNALWRHVCLLFIFFPMFVFLYFCHICAFPSLFFLLLFTFLPLFILQGKHVVKIITIIATFILSLQLLCFHHLVMRYFLL